MPRALTTAPLIVQRFVRISVLLVCGRVYTQRARLESPRLESAFYALPREEQKREGEGRVNTETVGRSERRIDEERSKRIARRSKTERRKRGEREKEDRGWPFCARRAKDAFESLIPFETLILGAKWRERTVFFG